MFQFLTSTAPYALLLGVALALPSIPGTPVRLPRPDGSTWVPAAPGVRLDADALHTQLAGLPADAKVARFEAFRGRRDVDRRESDMREGCHMRATWRAGGVGGVRVVWHDRGMACVWRGVRVG